MSLGDESQQGTIRALHGLIAAYSGPHWAHPAHAEHVLVLATELLDAVQDFGGGSGRRRMPRSMWPRAAVLEVPDSPPVPLAAL